MTPPSPRRPPAASSSSSTVAPDASTILIVEDDPEIRALFVSFLSHAGYRVLDAANGADALDVVAARKAKVDLLVTDVVMPRSGGAALAATLRERQPWLRVLFVSGYDHGDLAGDTEASARLQKPVTRSRLLASVAALLGHRAPTDAG